MRGGAMVAELQRVADQVLEELAELGGIGRESGQPVVRDHRAGFRNRHLQIAQAALEDRLAVDRLKRPASSNEPRICEQIPGSTAACVGSRRRCSEMYRSAFVVQPALVALRQQLW